MSGEPIPRQHFWQGADPWGHILALGPQEHRVLSHRTDAIVALSQHDDLVAGLPRLPRLPAVAPATGLTGAATTSARSAAAALAPDGPWRPTAGWRLANPGPSPPGRLPAPQGPGWRPEPPVGGAPTPLARRGARRASTGIVGDISPGWQGFLSVTT
jgi:hypothetical protein